MYNAVSGPEHDYSPPTHIVAPSTTTASCIGHETLVPGGQRHGPAIVCPPHSDAVEALAPRQLTAPNMDPETLKGIPIETWQTQLMCGHDWCDQEKGACCEVNLKDSLRKS